ncbi:MAG TPA: glycosyltransferase [Candidatus Poseidoniales archaeon]|jgi:hypothetical protein|nr:hypothetical protein [Euryarchaeota archaeon]DAC14919.1 MAG TPA: glycosyltransferase [Candidatus Poseidoniales archaeon]|tara:strand:+ start:825 stop:1763 length:939 start_codon:yes stop_codon:yes gene_type:complete
MRVLLVADRPGWAYDILAKSIKKHSAFSEIDIQYIVDIRRDTSKIDFSNYDVVFFFLWYDAMRYGVKINGFEFGKTCVGVHSLASWKKRKLNQQQASMICNQFAATGVISNEINSLLDLTRVFITPNGVESDLFHSSELPTLENGIRIMWVGNPGRAHHGDNKGFHSLVKPVLNEFSDRGVHLVTASPDTPVPRELMGEFYRNNHMLICASLHEGGPMPIVESLACGRPVITTSVGIVPEIVEDGKNGIIFNRSTSDLRKIIEKILNEPQLIERMSSHATESVSSRFAKNMAQSYDKMFKFVHERKRGETNE